MSTVKVKDYIVNNRLRGEDRFGRVRVTSRRLSAVYDIHSLRVGGISYLLDRGVPLAVVAAVAGHASLVMTLHYYVLERAHIRKKLSEVLRENPDLAMTAASVEARLKGTENPRSWLRAMSEEAYSALIEAVKGGGQYRITTRGICPGTRCEDGLRVRGKRLGDKGDVTIVPGSLCGLCLYHLYGTPFLPGMVREFNETLYALERIARKQIENREQERSYEAEGRYDEATVLRNEDELMSRRAEPDCAHLVRLYEMILESLGAENRRSVGNETQKFPLMAMGGARVAIEKASAFEQMKEILDVAELMPNMKSLVPDSILPTFQNRLLGVLVKNGVEPYLAGLPSTVARRAAMDMGDLLARSISSRSDLDDVFNGNRLLRDLGSGTYEKVFAGVTNLAAQLKEKEGMGRLNSCERLSLVTPDSEVYSN